MRIERRRLFLLAIGAAALGVVGSPSAGVATASAPGATDPSIAAKVNALLARMTLDEKLGQLQQQVPGATPAVLEQQAKAGMLGAVLDLTGAAKINALQHVAVDQSRLGIPLIFGFDTIHGYRTIFPIPLGEASSFDPTVGRTDAAVGADESRHDGISQVFAPMIDVSHEPRWGRVAEGAGEDPFLGSAFAAARVKGSQGSDYSAPDKVIATLKHYVAYGQPEGGRDYNTSDMSIQRLWNFYLPPFKAGVAAGAATVMSAFDPLNGVPASANHYTETDILKQQWGFQGFIDSDYTAVQELIAHGLAADGSDAARLALNAGTDMEMVSTNYVTYGKALVQQGLVSMRRIDDAVRRILTVKYQAGLFDHPYVDESQVAAHTLTAADRSAARSAAGESMVLLKNANNALPLSTSLHSIAVVGPLGNDQPDMLGSASGLGQAADAVTVLDGIKAAVPGATVTYTPGCAFNPSPQPSCTSADGFPAAAAAAQAADETVVVVGEPADISGEAEARSDINLPGLQQQLVEAIAKTGRPFVVVMMNGRPLTIPDLANTAPAILEAWFPGVEAGNAVADVLFGKVNPSGKLPISFPLSVGQVPIYYNHENTGRPCDPSFKWNSRYIDLPGAGCAPLYQFGYGLSYTTFSFSNLHLSTGSLKASGGSITVSVDVTNTGTRDGVEVAQLYIHDPVASIVQPVRRLRGFQRVDLAAGATKTVTFTLNRNDVGFYNNSGRFVVEPGLIETYVGDSSSAALKATFNVIGGEGGD